MNNRFVFIAPMYNASQYVGQMLASVIAQSYGNWKVILIDDVSSHQEQIASNNIITNFKNFISNCGNDPEKISVFWNDKDPLRGKQWEVSNVLFGLSKCDDNDIICRIDADDWLTDTDALMYINAIYTNSEVDALWTAHRWGYSDKNISGQMPLGVDPYLHPWVSSHLKTFRKRLLNNVSDENYRGEDGKYIRRAGDQAIYLPALYHAKIKGYFPKCMYHYTINDVPETYQTADSLFQRDEALFLRSRGYVK